MNKLISIFTNKIAHWIAIHTKIVLWLSLLVFITSLALSMGIKLNPNVRDMIPDDDPQVAAYDKIIANYITTEIVTISVEGENKNDIKEAMEYLAGEIKNDTSITKFVASFNYKPEKSFFSKWGLMFVSPKKLERVSNNPSLLEGLFAFNSQMDSLLSGEKELGLDTIPSMINSYGNLAVEKVNLLLEDVNDYLAKGEYDDSDSIANEIIERTIWEGNLMISPDEKMVVASIVPNFGSLEYGKTKKLVSRLYEIAEECESTYDGVNVGVAGNIAMNHDRTLAMTNDMSWPSLIALLLITLLFYFSLRDFRASILAILTLFFGIALSYGIISFYPGEINAASSMCIVILIGLGIDFGIHIITHYNHYLGEYKDAEKALRKTLTESGSGIIVGALTTAVAFFILTLSDSKGLSDLGFIAGVGILSCMFSMIIVLPAMLFAFGNKTGIDDSSLPPKISTKLSAFISKRAVVILVIALIASIYMGFLGSNNYKEISRLQMEDPEGQSIIAMERLLEKFNRSSDALLLTVGSVEKAREVKKKLLSNPQISKVETISDLIKSPEEQSRRLSEITELREKLSTATKEGEKEAVTRLLKKEINRLSKEDLDDHRLAIMKNNLKLIELDTNKMEIASPELLLSLYVSQLKTMQGNLREIVSIMKEDSLPMAKHLEGLVGTSKNSTTALSALIEQLDKPNKALALHSLDVSMRKYIISELNTMAKLDKKMTISDLPKSIASKYLSSDKSENLLRIFPKNDIWNTDVLNELERTILPEFPNVVGAALVFKRFNEHVFDEALRMSVYALIAVVFILLITLKSFKDTALVVLPLICGVVWMFGFMELFGLRYSFTSMISFPMVLGIGIDTGIHLFHGFKNSRDIGKMMQVTGKAVVLSSLTSMIGFGAIGFVASTGGVRNFGQTLFWGVGSCLVASIFVFSALLYLMNKKELNEK